MLRPPYYHLLGTVNGRPKLARIGKLKTYGRSYPEREAQDHGYQDPALDRLEFG
jgi:hypothetical protein